MIATGQSFEIELTALLAYLGIEDDSVGRRNVKARIRLAMTDPVERLESDRALVI